MQYPTILSGLTGPLGATCIDTEQQKKQPVDIFLFYFKLKY